MFQTIAPATGPAPAHRPPALALTQVVSRVFTTRGSRLDDPASADFLPAVARNGGVAFRPEVLAGTGNTFAAMIRHLRPVFERLPGPVDLVLLAHASPDLVPSAVAGPVVSGLLYGQPPAFAITDQGVSAPFTALSLAQLYAQRCDYDRLLVLLFDQAVLPYDVPDRPDVRLDGDAAVVLVLERRSPTTATGYEVRQDFGVPAAEIGVRLGHLWKSLVDDERTPVLLGPGIGAARPLPIGAADVRHVPAGQPCTGLWRALGWPGVGGPGVGGPGGAAVPGPVVLLDLDPATGDLSGCRIDLGPSTSGPPTSGPPASGPPASGPPASGPPAS